VEQEQSAGGWRTLPTRFRIRRMRVRFTFLNGGCCHCDKIAMKLASDFAVALAGGAPFAPVAKGAGFATFSLKNFSASGAVANLFDSSPETG
jgi:hypothetical protein